MGTRRGTAAMQNTMKVLSPPRVRDFSNPGSPISSPISEEVAFGGSPIPTLARTKDLPTPIYTIDTVEKHAAGNDTAVLSPAQRIRLDMDQIDADVRTLQLNRSKLEFMSSARVQHTLLLSSSKSCDK